MVPRPLAMAGLLGAAVGVPYAVSNAPEGWPPAATPQAATSPAQLPQPVGLTEPLDGVVNAPLASLVNWGITKEWVYAHWSRKTTGLGDPRLFGVRVPLVTGGRMTDVAGALSYYFDAAGALQRIRFHGRTADTTELVRLAAAHGMRQLPPTLAGDQLYQAVEREGRVRGQLRTRPEPVLHRQTPHSSFLVDLELNRPGSAFWVQPEQPRLEVPDAAAVAAIPVDEAGAASLPGMEKPPEGTPVLPHRSVVPDAPNGAASQPAAETAKQPPPPAVARPRLQPVYRDELRWPY